MIQYRKKGKKGVAAVEDRLIVDAGIDGRTFSEYAFFDVMGRQRRWLRPLFFALIFTAFGLLAFSLRGRRAGAPLLSGVLLGVGLLLPLGYLLSFFLSVRRQSRAMDGKTPAYTLTLAADGLTVKKGEQTLHVAWRELYAAHRLKHSICLYTDARHAFLLPRACGEERFDAAWRLIGQNLDPGKCRNHTK